MKNELTEVNAKIKAGFDTDRITLKTQLFPIDILAKAEQHDKSINENNSSLYAFGIEAQDQGRTVSNRQALGILLTHRKIEAAVKVLSQQSPKRFDAQPFDSDPMSELKEHLKRIRQSTAAIESLLGEHSA
jgi:uncharacterized protein YaaN involved in tellurite resistance